jgi:hypothetical protein
MHVCCVGTCCTCSCVVWQGRASQVAASAIVTSLAAVLKELNEEHGVDSGRPCMCLLCRLARSPCDFKHRMGASASCWDTCATCIHVPTCCHPSITTFACSCCVPQTIQSYAGAFAEYGDCHALPSCTHVLLTHCMCAEPFRCMHAGAFAEYGEITALPGECYPLLQVL